MKKFVIKTTVLAILVVAIDYLVGKTFSLLVTHAAGGDTKRLALIVDELKDEMVIYGSSRAMHHYDPLILQDSLGISCFNAGRDGNGIIYNYGQYKLMCAHYTPKVIVYDVQQNFDLLEDDKTKYLDWLKRYYGRSGIDSLFWTVDKTLRVKMLSQMYRYNGSFIQIASDCVSPLQEDVKGYRPLDAFMDYEPLAKPQEKADFVYDSLKLEYWHRFITDCKQSGTTLFFTLSPLYKAKPSDVAVFKPIIDIAKENGIPFIDHYADTTFCLHRKYFKDTAHMNRIGATTYTQAIIKEFRTYIKK